MSTSHCVIFRAPFIPKLRLSSAERAARLLGAGLIVVISRYMQHCSTSGESSIGLRASLVVGRCAVCSLPVQKERLAIDLAD